MKRRLFALLLGLIALLCAVPASAEEAAAPAEVVVSTNAGDLKLNDNENGNYIKGIGMNNSPAASFLHANEKGGVTLVQYISRAKGVAVAEFDGELNFLNCRYLPVDEELMTWGGFCAGEEYYYIAYRVRSQDSSAILKVEKYDRDWTLVKSNLVTCSGAGSIINNDFDMVESGGLLHIITNQIFGSGSGKGHQANMHLELYADSLDKTMQHIGVSTYPGYTSHSYMPEVVVSGSNLFTFDRSDTYPTPGLFVTRFNGSFSLGGMMSGPYAWSGDWRAWGNLGNAIPAPGGQALLAYNEGAYGLNGVPDNCDVYLFHTGTGAKKVSGSTGAGTPYVAAASNTVGYVLWNPDLYGSQPRDDLYYAAFVAGESSLVVSTVLKAEGHYLSDCEPITFDGGLLWFSVEDGELVFHQLKVNKAPTKKIAHRYEVVEGREPTCSKPGLTEGTACALCGEIGVAQEEIPVVPHTEEILPAREATCGLVGLTEGKRCTVCGVDTVEQQEIPGPPHTEEILPGWEATCSQKGRTEGRICTVCGQTTVQYQYLDRLPHTEVVRPGYAPSCTYEGRTDGTKCDVCGLILDYGVTIPKTSHDPVEVPARPGTCLEEGCSAGTACGMCGKILVGCKPTGLGDHESVAVEAVPPTASCTGLTAGTKCALCDEQLSGGEVIPALVVDVVSVGVEGEQVTLRAALKYGGYYMMCAFYDEDGALMGVMGEKVWARKNGLGQRENEAEYDVTFALIPNSASFRIFALNYEGDCEFAPVCQPIVGKI